MEEKTSERAVQCQGEDHRCFCVHSRVKSKSGPCDSADKTLASQWEFLWVTGSESESQSAAASQKHVTNQSGPLTMKEEVGINAYQH